MAQNADDSEPTQDEPILRDGLWRRLESMTRRIRLRGSTPAAPAPEIIEPVEDDKREAA